MRVRIRAYAKINLGLKVLGRREDGYHEIQTVMQSISLADELLLEPGGRGLALEVEPELGLPAEENLVYRAARLILDRAGCSEGVHIRLLKRIPVGAGLGGASSDGAATLLGLNELFRLGFGKEELKALGSELGSDVPFFFEGGLCRAEGRGEALTRLPPPLLGSFIVLLKPPCSLRTADVYAEFDRTGKIPSIEGPKFRIGLGYDLMHAAIRPRWGRPFQRYSVDPAKVGRGKLDYDYELDLTNDLEPAARRLCPELERYRSFLERWEARAAPKSRPFFFGMSGSGPTYYAIGSWPDGFLAGRRRSRFKRLPSTFHLFRRAPELERFMEEAREQLGAWVFLCHPTQVGHELELEGSP